MKKIFSILATFLGIGFIICVALGFIIPISNDIYNSSKTLYKFLNGIDYFLSFLPGIILAGFIISFSVYFGHNSEGSTSRFSKEMLNRFKYVVISSLVCGLILALANESFGILTKTTKERIINKPKIINEYIKVGNNLFDNGYYTRALRYANAALELDNNSKEASNLKDKSTVEINRIETSNLHFKLYENEIEVKTVDRVLINPEQISEVFELYKQALNCFKDKQWFNAHYYAELGIALATPKDPNLANLKDISNSAWKNLTEYVELKKDVDQLFFEKKYEGYLALHQKDDLKAYYIFKELSDTSRELSIDPDVTFYLNVAENRIREKYFFIDETFEQKSFENANNVYYSYDYRDGSKDIVYFKGVTTVEETGNSIQYLRDLSIVTISPNGEIYKTLSVPYAKVLPVSTDILNETTKQLFEIDEKTKSIPYIMLCSIGRTDPNTKIKPTYTYSKDAPATYLDYLILPISFDDFEMLENNTINPSSISLIKLIKLITKAEKYGFSQSVFLQVLINRILFPLWILILFIFAATFAWHNRIGVSQYFKFSWVFSFPFVILLCLAFYKIAMFVYMLINYVLIDCFRSSVGIIAAVIFYILLLILVSIYFASRRAKE